MSADPRPFRPELGEWADLLINGSFLHSWSRFTQRYFARYRIAPSFLEIAAHMALVLDPQIREEFAQPAAQINILIDDDNEDPQAEPLVQFDWDPTVGVAPTMGQIILDTIESQQAQRFLVGDLYDHYTEFRTAAGRVMRIMTRDHYDLIDFVHNGWGIPVDEDFFRQVQGLMEAIHSVAVAGSFPDDPQSQQWVGLLRQWAGFERL